MHTRLALITALLRGVGNLIVLSSQCRCDLAERWVYAAGDCYYNRSCVQLVRIGLKVGSLLQKQHKTLSDSRCVGGGGWRRSRWMLGLSLDLPTLKLRRLRGDMIETYKVPIRYLWYNVSPRIPITSEYAIGKSLKIVNRRSRYNGKPEEVFISVITNVVKAYLSLSSLPLR